MKRTYMLMTLVLGTVLILTACSGASPSDGTEFPDLNEAPGLPGDVETPVITDTLDTPGAPVETPMETEAEATPTVEAGPVVTETESIPSTGETDAGLVTNLLEFGVFSQDDERVGDTEDLVVDIESMELDYLIVNADGKLIPVPWKLVTIVTSEATTSSTDGPQNDFQLTVDRATLMDAPSFASEEFPDTKTMDWDADIRAYWEEYLPAQSGYPAP